ncbi:hypothetical protein HPT27_01360 [Permianibacter sp. IMCC34836]|uniref:hypothetical protein n=1 Tax=Permianibacter fluminis TaxID=2738515 RepID=UPI0015572650|nr:hypothetical protein [Permianibacter fluminis]NQD35650.1 hypothetical protein [Permianibacter fluminis]
MFRALIVVVLLFTTGVSVWLFQEKRASVAIAKMMLVDIEHSADVLALLEKDESSFKSSAQPLLYHAFFVINQLSAMKFDLDDVDVKRLAGICYVHRKMNVWSNSDDVVFVNSKAYLSKEGVENKCN